MDRILPVFLQEGLEILLSHLMNLFRSSLAWSYIPTKWAAVRVVYIPKPGTNSPCPKAYRPSSLTFFFLKAMEKIIDWHIRQVVLRASSLYVQQYAYQKGKSTELALSDLVGQISRTLDQKEIMMAAFLDIEGAFNNALANLMNKVVADKGANPIYVTGFEQ